MENNYHRRKGYLRRGFRRNQRRRSDDRTSSPNQIDPICPICTRPIREISSAIAFKTTNAPAHIECIISELRKTEELLLNERICYLGKGTFGIVVRKDPSNPVKFSIKKKIQYEESNITPEWRKKIAT
jgi:hypothetical protein